MKEAVLRVGQEPIAGYHLKQFRGQGSFGQVWEADTKDGPVALKFLPCNDSLSAAKEIRALQAVRQLSHSGIVRIHQVWCHSGHIIVGMELADGNLLDLLEAYQTEFGTPIEPEQILLYLGQVARALDYMNSRHHLVDGRKTAYQHCDIKPSNLLLFGETCKVGDLGLACATTSALKQHHMGGTLEYMAPEMLQGRLSDFSDQYALAMTYCHLRGGRLVSSKTTTSLPQSLSRPAPDLSMLPDKERPIVARALSTQPLQRWPSCSELIHRLTAAAVPPRGSRPREMQMAGVG